MFQAVMNPKERRDLGAHYTSEKNIQKLIRPLFLDSLYEEFEKAKASQPKLLEFQRKIASLKFLDPACGSGNFLIISYRELRQLEIEILKELFFVKQKQRREVMADAGINLDLFVKVNVDQFYGIEIDEFAAKIAEVGMWLIDHQMNIKVSEEFWAIFCETSPKKSSHHKTW
jgi:type II restriction/modification system DNA methylase subunit YeeA